MSIREAGKVLITSSIASTMPGSYQAVYNASKSFLQSFAEAINYELAGTGVTVTSLMPGPTGTQFFHRADMDDTRIGQMIKDDPAKVAQRYYPATWPANEQQWPLGATPCWVGKVSRTWRVTNSLFGGPGNGFQRPARHQSRQTRTPASSTNRAVPGGPTRYAT